MAVVEKSPVLEELAAIDTSVVDELTNLKKQRQELADRGARLAKEKAKVTEIVYERVRRDYDDQRTALDEKAAPLEDQARLQYAKVAALSSKVEAAAEATKLNMEEVKLRHRVGEFDDAEFQRQAGDIEALEKGQKRELAALRKVQKSFVAAFESEADLLQPSSAEAASSPKPSKPLKPSKPPKSGGSPKAPKPTKRARAPKGSKSSAPPKPPAPRDPKGDGSDPTSAVRVDTATDLEELEIPDGPAGAEVAPTSRAATRMLDEESGVGCAKTNLVPLARLVPMGPAAGDHEFPIEPLTSIGRTSDNVVTIDDSTVSRMHAEIALIEEGFELRDLKSQNGTYVNGEAVERKVLAEGDRVQFGTVRYVFRVS